MQGFIFASLSLLCLGIGWFFAARSSKDMSPLTSLFLFQLIGIPFFVLLLPWAPSGFDPSFLLPIILVGIFETFVMLLLFYAMRIGDVSVVMPVSGGYAAITMILGAMFLSEALTPGKVSGMALVLAGITLISTQVRTSHMKSIFSLRKGVLPALGAALGGGIYLFFIGIVVRGSNWFVTALGIRIAISFTALVILFLKRENVKQLFQNVSWKWIIPGALLDVLGFSFYNMAVSVGDVSYATVMISAQSLITVLLGFFILKETIAVRQWLGIGTAVVGLVLLQI